MERHSFNIFLGDLPEKITVLQVKLVAVVLFVKIAILNRKD